MLKTDRTDYSGLRMDSRKHIYVYVYVFVDLSFIYLAHVLTWLQQMSASSAHDSPGFKVAQQTTNNTASRKTEVLLASAMYS